MNGVTIDKLIEKTSMHRDGFSKVQYSLVKGFFANGEVSLNGTWLRKFLSNGNSLGEWGRLATSRLVNGDGGFNVNFSK